MVTICFDPKHIGNAISVLSVLGHRIPTLYWPLYHLLYLSSWLPSDSLLLLFPWSLSVSWSLVPALAGYLLLLSATSLWFVITGFTFLIPLWVSDQNHLLLLRRPWNDTLLWRSVLPHWSPSTAGSCSYIEATGISVLCLKGGQSSKNCGPLTSLYLTSSQITTWRLINYESLTLA